MSKVEICRAGWPLSSSIRGVALLAVLAFSLSGCAMKMPSFGFGKTDHTTASLPKDRYAMGAPPAAYGQSDYDNPPASYRAAPLRPQRPASPWVWSEGKRGTKTITVQPGESLYGIASRRHVAISELMAANRLSGPNVVPGQKLLVPLQNSDTVPDRSARTATRLADPDQRYDRRDRWDDTRKQQASYYDRVQPYQRQPRLFERSTMPLSRRSDSPRADIRSQRVSRRTASDTYRVKPGDTLYAIARHTGIKPSRLARHNRLSDPSRIRPGMILKLPR